MSEYTKYGELKKRLEGICEENNLVYSLNKSGWPVTLTIRPAGGLDAQLSMLEEAEDEGFIDQDAFLRFTYVNGELQYKMDKKLTISDALFNKLKNLYKKLYFFWLQHLVRRVVELNLLSADELALAADKSETDTDEVYEAVAGETSDGEFSRFNEELIDDATEFLRGGGSATIAALQKEFTLTYAVGAALMDELEAAGVVGPFSGSAPREVLPASDD